MGSIKVPIDVESTCSNRGKGDDLKADSYKSNNGKRKRQTCTAMLNWILKVAKDPLQSDVLQSQPWKGLLLARDAMFLTNLTSEPSIWQKRQKMHPTMYDDNEFDCHRKQVPIGTAFQAHLPELSGKSDLKWLGTKIWPLPNGGFTTDLIKIGKGRQESCSCHFPGSPQCIKYHIREKTNKLKLELGLSFYKWRFNCMGEDAALFWTKLDETMFQVIVESNRVSSENYFWDQLFNCFPNKGREALVSYYFNVFLLRRRSLQNRSVVMDIDSDDDESEFGPVSDKFGR